MNTETKEPSDFNEDAEVAQRVQNLLLESGNCAQTSFAILCDEHDLEGSQILKALTPFPGIALRGETCGAVIGSLMALGLVYGREDLSDWKGYIGSLPAARRFCAQFEEENGSTACSDLLQQKLGQDYNLADRFQAAEYAHVGGPQACAEIVTSAVRIASERLSEKGR